MATRLGRIAKKSAPAEARVGSRLLKERAYAELKQGVVTGRYPPGSFLSERRLVEELGMSKTPIRAALERLELEGFVAVSPRQGILVRELSLAEIADQFEIRLALEGFVLQSLAGRLTRPQLQRLRGHLREQEQTARRNDVETSVWLDGEFHLLFCELLGNQEILRVMLQLREKVTWVIGLVFQQNTERLMANYREHRAVADAVIEGDPEAAWERLRSHLEYGKHSLLARRRDTGPAGP